MEYTLLYVLTVKCTSESCEEDLAVYRITSIDENAIYTDNKKYLRSALMEVVIIKADKEEMILRVPFLIKEAAIIWIREVFIKIKEKGTKEMIEATNEEWEKIKHPYYDKNWFTGGKKVEEWKAEMNSVVDKL